MRKRERIINTAINSSGQYLSSETGQYWQVIPKRDKKEDNRNYEIWHKHPGRNKHFQGYAQSLESAVRKIAKHENWTVKKAH